VTSLQRHTCGMYVAAPFLMAGLAHASSICCCCVVYNSTYAGKVASTDVDCARQLEAS
jgi:hypothetical protein